MTQRIFLTIYWRIKSNQVWNKWVTYLNKDHCSSYWMHCFTSWIKRNKSSLVKTAQAYEYVNILILTGDIRTSCRYSFWCCAGFLSLKVYQCKYFWPIYVLHVLANISELELVLSFLNVFVAFSVTPLHFWYVFS